MKLWLYLSNGYTCDDELTLDVSFIVNGLAKKYTFDAVASTDRETVFFIVDLMSEDCLADFKDCSSVKIRLNDTTCGSIIYQFNMSGSTSALNFMINE